MYLAKDFIETAEGLVFAVVENGIEQGMVLCFLRYRRTADGWQKQSTRQADDLLNRYYPDYLYHCPNRDVRIHAVPEERIIKHYQPKQRLSDLLSVERPDPVEQDLLRLSRLYQSRGLDIKQMGVTGSLLIGAQGTVSDIDLVFYDRALFHQARSMTRELVQDGLLCNLGHSHWQESYRRRDCHIDFGDYVWHELRKFNKALVNDRKFDLNFIDPEPDATQTYRKCGEILLRCIVTDDRRAFDYPALYQCDEPTIDAIVVFTATYTGQAQVGEAIEVRGLLEESENGLRRIIVGSSREAEGEYIKVQGSRFKMKDER